MTEDRENLMKQLGMDAGDDDSVDLGEEEVFGDDSPKDAANFTPKIVSGTGETPPDVGAKRRGRPPKQAPQEFSGGNFMDFSVDKKELERQVQGFITLPDGTYTATVVSFGLDGQDKDGTNRVKLALRVEGGEYNNVEIAKFFRLKSDKAKAFMVAQLLRAVGDASMDYRLLGTAEGVKQYLLGKRVILESINQEYQGKNSNSLFIQGSAS